MAICTEECFVMFKNILVCKRNDKLGMLVAVKQLIPPTLSRSVRDVSALWADPEEVDTVCVLR